jgi:biopolymer transport protein ExbD
MRRHKRRKRNQGDVELNLAAMLDMAFQLLTFFILTFRPSPVEGQIDLRLPPPQPVTNITAGETAGADESNPNPIQGLNSLVITVMGNQGGGIEAIALGENSVSNLALLESRVHSILADKGSGFDQVIVQAGSSLHYDQLMKIVDICTRAKLPDGQRLSKLSFVELPTGP